MSQVKATGKDWAASFAGTLFVMAAFTPMAALWVMLAAGITHQYWPVVPPFGYWETYVLLLGVNVLGAAVKVGIKVTPTGSKSS